LAIIGLGWNVFVSGVYKGAQKIMCNSTILKKMTEKAQQLVWMVGSLNKALISFESQIESNLSFAHYSIYSFAFPHCGIDTINKGCWNSKCPFTFRPHVYHSSLISQSVVVI
jgi:hypothetical protein